MVSPPKNTSESNENRCLINCIRIKGKIFLRINRVQPKTARKKSLCAVAFCACVWYNKVGTVNMKGYVKHE